MFLFVGAFLPRCPSYGSFSNQCSPSAYCSLDKVVAWAQHMEMGSVARMPAKGQDKGPLK